MNEMEEFGIQEPVHPAPSMPPTPPHYISTIEGLEFPDAIPPAPAPTTPNHLFPEISMLPYDASTEDNGTTTEPKGTGQHRNRFRYASFPKFLQRFLQEAEPRLYSLREIANIYEEKTGRRISRQARQKAARKLQNISIERHEQLWLTSSMMSSDDKSTSSMDGSKLSPDAQQSRAPPSPTPAYEKKSGNSLIQTSLVERKFNKKPGKLHSSHKNRFSIRYRGEQPVKGAEKVARFGRYGTAIQVTFPLISLPSGASVRIKSFRGRLHVWVHHPKGVTEDEQIREASADAYRVIVGFTREHSISVRGEFLAYMRHSHFVVEEPEVNSAFGPLFKQYGPILEQETGERFGDSSHPGKWEHQGISREESGLDYAKGLRRMLLEVPGRVEALEGEFGTMRYAIDELKREVDITQRKTAEVAQGIGEVAMLLKTQIQQR